MAVFPQKPRSGQKVLQGLYNSVCQIIDYLPSLEVRGDSTTTSVSKTSIGTIVHANGGGNSTVDGVKYYGHYGVAVTGRWIYSTLNDGRFIDIQWPEQSWPQPDSIPINCTLSGDGTYIDITTGGIITYIGPTPGGGGTGDNFGVPNLSALNYSNEPLANDGNGLTWLIPVSAGQQFTYSTGASGNVNASYAPAKGKSGSSFAITRDVLSTIPQDGYVRITAFDDGLHHNQCLRVFDGTTNWNEGLPLYKFSNWSSAVIPSGGRYTTVQLTSTRINAQEQEEIYTLPNPIINNMLSGGKYITIQETDQYDVKLQYPLINCTLHGDGTTVTIDENGTISAIGGGGGGTVIASGVPYPNYQELRHDDYGGVSGIGISWLLPVKKNSNVCFYTAAGSEHAYATFATHEIDENDHYQRATIYNGQPYVPSTDGWVRLSVFDDGTHAGECLRFTDSYSDSNSWNYATPLYRFHGFKALSGDGTTIDVVGNTISGRYTGDGSKIQVQGNTISWIGGATGGGFKAPKYNLLNLGSSDTGIAASGLGTTYLVPVSNGSSIWYQGTAEIAIWVPVEGSEITQRHDVPNTSNSAWSTTDDGYVRLTVFDDGTNAGGCLKLHVGANGVLPLHKYSTALSGAAGIAVENNGIRNMIQPGTGLTSSALNSPAPNSVMTGIAFDLSAQYAADLASISGRLSATTDEDRILSSHNGTLLWAENSASYTPPSTVFNLLSQGSGIQLTKLSDGKTKIDCTVQGGGGGGSNEYIRWPNYANLHNNGNSISIQQDYTCDGNGGWLRISYKGQPQQQGSDYCYSLMIDGNAVGMYTLNSTLGMMGNTWILPIPPFSRFMVNFPTSNTYAYFDGAVYDSGDIQTIYATIIADRDGASGACNNAEQRYATASGCAYSSQYDYVNFIEADNLNDIDWYWDEYYTARRCVTGYIDAEDPDYNESGSIHYAAEAAEYATLASTEAARMIAADEDILGRANSYATEAANWATSASNWSTAASGAADDCYNWYLSAAAHFGITPRAKDYPNNDSH